MTSIDKRLLVLETLLGFVAAIKLPMRINQCMNASHGEAVRPRSDCICEHMGHTVVGRRVYPETIKRSATFRVGKSCLISSQCQCGEELNLYPGELESTTWNP